MANPSKPRPASPALQEKAVKVTWWWRRNKTRLFPQWARTWLFVLMWVGLSRFYGLTIAPAVNYMQASYSVAAFAIASGIVISLYPPKTSPWRTLAWEVLAGAALGPFLILAGVGTATTPICLIVMFLILIGRAKQNARKVWQVIKEARGK